MRSVKFVGFVLAVTVTCAAMFSAPAFAAAKYLELTASGHPVGPHTELNIEVDEGEEGGASGLTTIHGAPLAECFFLRTAYVTTNDAKSDVLTIEGTFPYEISECASEFNEGEPVNPEPLVISTMTLGVKGKASADVTVTVDGEPPYQHCVYSNKKLPGTNTTSGPLEVEFSGPLKGKGCAEKKVDLRLTEWESFLFESETGLEASVK
jgi:hypothetical protein